MALCRPQGTYLTSDGLSETFVGLREPFIDMNGSRLMVLYQPEMILFGPRGGHVSLRGPFVASEGSVLA